MNAASDGPHDRTLGKHEAKRLLEPIVIAVTCDVQLEYPGQPVEQQPAGVARAAEESAHQARDVPAAAGTNPGHALSAATPIASAALMNWLGMPLLAPVATPHPTGR
jgi:hypothetical protein